MKIMQQQPLPFAEMPYECQVCDYVPAQFRGISGEIGTLLRQIGTELFGGGKNSQRIRQIQADTASFQQFLAKVPLLVSERVEQKRQEAAAMQQCLQAERLRMQRLDGLLGMTAREFENAVGALWLSSGYRVCRTPGSGDRGIDLILQKPKETVAVQCKKYKKVVGEHLVREFYGSFVGVFQRGFFVTTSTYTEPCLEWAARRKKLWLIDGQMLAELMVERNPDPVTEFELWKTLRTREGRKR